MYTSGGILDTDVIEGTGDGDISAGATLFAENAAKQLDWYKPEKCGIERYQLRAGTGFVGLMERVNIIIGCILAECRTRDIECYLVTPSVHKVWSGRYFEATKKSGKLCMLTCPEFENLPTEHEADAASVARYCSRKIFQPPIK